MRDNLNVSYENNGTYATKLFANKAVKIIDEHDQTQPLFLYLPHLAPHTANEDHPLQAPDDVLKEFAYIKDENRRKYAAMVSLLDKAVGDVIDALDKKNMLNNSIILFFSDNGAPIEGINSNSGTNFPFRGVSLNLT